MKHISITISTIIALSSATLLFTSCEKVKELTQFSIETNTEITIPATAGINFPIEFQTPDVQTNSESTFENNDTRTDLIEEVRLDECNLSITSPSTGTFDFLKSVEIYISGDNLPEVLIAEKQDIQNGNGSEMSLDTTGEDLKEYLKNESYNLRVEVVTDQTIGSSYDINIESIFFVDAKILGL